MSTENRKSFRRTRSGFETAAGSDKAFFIATVFTTIIWFLTLLIPAIIRRTLHRWFSLFRAKILLGRLQLNALQDPNGGAYYHFKSIETEMTTADGEILKMTHFFPERDDGERHPCILFRTPYYRYFDYAFALHFVHRGYHVIMQDIRGRFESTGTFTLGENEIRDCGCTMKWLSQQQWSDKTLGVIGLSMGGYGSWSCVANYLQNYKEHGVVIRGIIPAITSSDILTDGMFVKTENPDYNDPVVHLDLMAKYIKLNHEISEPIRMFGSYLLYVGYKIFNLHKTYTSRDWKKKIMHLPLKDLDLVLTEDVPDPRKEVNNDPELPENKRMNLRWAVEKMGAGEGAVPMYGCFVSGWYDIFGKATVKDFQAACKAEKEAGLKSSSGASNVNRLQLIMGDFTHFDDYIVVLMRAAVRTFDAAFDSDKFVYPQMKRVLVVCVGANGFYRRQRPTLEQVRGLLFPATYSCSMANERHHCWRQFDSWPPAESNTQSMCLSAAKYLIPLAESDETDINAKIAQNLALWGECDSFMWNPFEPTPSVGGALFGHEAGMGDQSCLVGRNDTLFFCSPKIVSAFEIAGNVSFSCWVQSSVISMDLVAKLCIVGSEKDGKPKIYNLCEGIQRATLKKGETWPRKLSIDMGPIAAQFGEGTKIGLILSGGSFPLYGRNLGLGEPVNVATRMIPGKHSVLWKGSQLDLPVLNQVNCCQLPTGFSLQDAIDEGHHHIVKRVLSPDEAAILGSPLTKH